MCIEIVVITPEECFLLNGSYLEIIEGLFLSKKQFRFCKQTDSISESNVHIVAYFLKIRIVEPEEPQFLGNGCVTRNNTRAISNFVQIPIF
jgi:hypothetical protein